MMFRVFVSSVGKTNATQSVRIAGFDSLLAYCIPKGRIHAGAGVNLPQPSMYDTLYNLTDSAVKEEL